MEKFAEFKDRIINVTSIDFCGEAFYEKHFSGVSEISFGYELVFIKEGRIIYTINGYPVRLFPGSILLVPPGRIVTTGADSSFAEIFMIKFEAEGDFAKEDYYVSNCDFFRLRMIKYVEYLADASQVTKELAAQLTRVATENIVLMVLASHNVNDYEMFISSTAENLYKVYSYLKCRLKNNLTDEVIAAENGLSVSNLRRIFRKYTGVGAANYLNKMRILSAMENCRGKSLSQICEENGFCSESYFCKMFKKETGRTFGEYKKEVFK